MSEILLLLFSSTTIFLNSVSGKLLASILFSSFSGDFSCSFIWGIFVSSFWLSLCFYELDYLLCLLVLVGWLYIVGVLWGTAFCVTIAGHSGEPPCGLTFLLQLSLVCHISGKDLPPSPSSARSGCNHYGAPAVQKPVPQSKIHFSSALVPTESSFEYVVLENG